MPRRGRRPGVSVSRATILAAARRYFAAVGYDRATIRAIARAAKVDPALVLHYFGTKETLFSEALDFPRPDQVLPVVLGGGAKALGPRIATLFFDMWESEHGAGLLRILHLVHTSDRAAAMMREFIASELLARMAPTLSGRDRELRATSP